MRKDPVMLKTQINWKSFGDYDKNMEKLSDEKKEKQKRKAFIEEAMASLDNHYLRWCNELYLLPWLVKHHSLNCCLHPTKPSDDMNYSMRRDRRDKELVNYDITK
jgi:hypothetical protein